ncbi:FG-GAP-like repeat-containing protein [Ravibacter arvi]|uniref:FG-GAP-like repeat-containing protein n=1 Tax=Ravibacter arvi TaxID=2051041 RepID=A0ABP8LS39_9BACT
MRLLYVALLPLFGGPAVGQQPKKIKFTPYFVAAESFESVGVFDVNNDGKPDLLSGDFYYLNDGDPKTNFRKRHRIGDQPAYAEYFDDFATIPMDVNQDGRMDFITGGWFGETLRWHENPGKPAPWPAHEIAKTGNVETVRAWDLDGDGIPEIVPNTPNSPLQYFRKEAAGKFSRHEVGPYKSHGLGFGDINGDGKGDLIVKDGWIENKGANNWEFHQDFDLGRHASIPIIVTDLNGDGKNDLIAGTAHDYGIFWYEQQMDSAGKRSFKKHLIDDKASQYHELVWEDITGDGKPELITGKRYRAHNDGDPGAHDDVGLYYFTWDGKKFAKHVIAFGPPGTGKGTGIFMQLADLRGTGRKDIIVAGKDGLWIFFNEGVK